ncbi:hypothetical protein AKJ09_07028 [Labilithrix luteola]|uniref:Uncharacterized protein n=1 Tax=Labilithrix luteola TaxID=1391654 RepID=A0A0K1Q4P5_9BACT|nr:hypothetical protein [Labilithrix luteola]AKV00365.1 hypothetical protein AKJ09_07028 [Labilithrix luteola]
MYSTSGGRVVLSWAALGLPTEAQPPRRFVVCLAGTADIAHVTGGMVFESQSFVWDEVDGEQQPPRDAEDGGLFDERVFGALPRTAEGHLALDASFDRHPCDRPQGRLFGTLMLPLPVASPWSAAAPELGALPVLPPAFRSSVATDGAVRGNELTKLYEGLLVCCGRIQRLLELGSPDDVLDGEQERLALAVRDLLESLRHHLVSDIGQKLRWLDTTLGDEPDLLSLERWPEPMHTFRAMLTAACLEIVPLGEDGHLDLERLRDARDAAFFHATTEVHGWVFDEPRAIWHPTEREEGVPHVAVHAYATNDGVVLLTSGTSRQPIQSDEEDELPFIELACLLPGDAPDATLEGMSRALWSASVTVLRHGLRLSEPTVLSFEEPVVPNSALSGFVVVPSDIVNWADWADTFETALPMRPKVLVAIGLTSEQLACIDGNEEDLEDILALVLARDGLTRP